MSRSHGVGIPITLKCSKCKLSRVKTIDDPYGINTSAEMGDLVQTGRRRPLYGPARNRGGQRLLSDQRQYRCKKCGFVGWTRHKDILRKPYDQPFHVKMKEKKDAV
jgi:hypothetical protein